MKKFLIIMSSISLIFSVALGFDDRSLSSLREGLSTIDHYDDANFYLQPVNDSSSWHVGQGNKSGYKFFCTGSAAVYTTLSGSELNYGALAWYLKYDNLLLDYKNQTFAVDTDSEHDVYDNYSIGQSKWFKFGNSSPLTNTKIVTFRFVPKTTERSQIWFDFCNKYGTICTYNYDEMLDISEGLYYFDKNSNNYLGSVKGAIYDLYAYPCTIDTSAPLIIYPNTIPTYTGNYYFTGLVVDASNSSWGYWFGGTNRYSETGLNYVSAPNTIDNQGGVRSDSITVKLEYLSGNHNPSIVNSRVVLTTWGGGTVRIGSRNYDRNSKTWNSNDRGYIVGFTGEDLEPEKPVKITITASDNPNETGAIHTGNGSPVTINMPNTPTIASGYNTNGTEWRTANVFPSRENEYMITVTDSPAGIDINTLTIKFDEIDDNGIYMTGYTLTPSNGLNVSPVGTPTYYGSNTSYEVRFNPQYDLPEAYTVTMRVTVRDSAGNTGTKVFTLSTRAACSEFGGCRDYLNINHFSNLDAIRLFSGLNIVVTGTDLNSIYPYLTGDTLFCGNPWTGMTLYPEGKMNLYRRGERDIKDSLTITRPNQNMYKAERSDDLDYDTERTSDSRSLVNKINVR